VSVRWITAKHRGLKRTLKVSEGKVPSVASCEWAAITTARRERGMAAMLFLRVGLPREAPATRAGSDDAMRADMLVDVVPVCVGGRLGCSCASWLIL
tara:strand:- start:971 stop:1261 length:291 start_codon:yes stop_codon:yes gene_type:complete